MVNVIYQVPTYERSMPVRNGEGNREHENYDSNQDPDSAGEISVEDQGDQC
jgi:hypothetical protein